MNYGLAIELLDKLILHEISLSEVMLVFDPIHRKSCNRFMLGKASDSDLGYISRCIDDYLCVYPTRKVKYSKRHHINFVTIAGKKASNRNV